MRAPALRSERRSLVLSNCAHRGDHVEVRAGTAVPEYASRAMFEEVEARLTQLQSHLPFDAATEERLSHALDPLFIYHSNALEGNTLSYADTLYFIEEDRTPGGKRREELLEVEGQVAAVRYLREAVRSQFEMSEKLIREFHQLLTQSLPADRYEPGRYKSRDNQVMLADGTLFPYVTFLETPAAMRELVAWHREAGPKLHPIEHAAQFHYKFILIHPFLDGNGRTVRLLTRLVLAERGYPPVAILRSQEHRSRYIDALRAVDTSVPQAELGPTNPDLKFFPFVNYLENEVLWSLDEVISVLEGRVVLTPSDLVGRFEQMEQNALRSKGIPLDEGERNALVVRRVEKVVQVCVKILDPAIRLANERMHELEVALRTDFGALGELRTRPDLPYVHLAIRDNPTQWGRYGIVTIVIQRRRGGISGLEVPQNHMNIMVIPEPHRLSVWVARSCQIGGRWNHEDDPTSWSARMTLPMPESELRESELSTFLSRQLGQFIDLVSAEISRPAPG
jgi:fido (protein-threonine AMPylation protein)